MWYDLALNPKAVVAIFGEEEPSLRNAHITSLDLNWNGPAVRLSVELENYPTHPPSKYISREWNTAIALLRLSFIESIHIDGWGTQNLVDIDIQKTSEKIITLRAKGSECSIEVKFGFLDVSITGYKSSLR